MMSWSACLLRSATDQLGPHQSARPTASYTISWDIIFRPKTEWPTEGSRGTTRRRDLSIFRLLSNYDNKEITGAQHVIRTSGWDRVTFLSQGMIHGPEVTLAAVV